MDTLGGSELSSYNRRDDSKYNETNTNDQEHRTRGQEIDSVLGNTIIENGSNGEAVKDTGKTINTHKMMWLEVLMVFCASVSVVGLSYVVNTSASPYRRSIWFLLILVGVGFTTYQLQDRIRLYRSYPVNVLVRVKHADEMRFPTVTICNENRASLSKASASGKLQSCVFSVSLSLYVDSPSTCCIIFCSKCCH